jgi:hypothetical protein
VRTKKKGGLRSGRKGSIANNRVELLLTVEEGNQLISCPLSAEGKSNCREPVNRVESEQDIVVLAKKESEVSITPLKKDKKDIDRSRSRGKVSGQRYLELIDEHGDGVELVCVWRFSHGVSRGRDEQKTSGGGKGEGRVEAGKTDRRSTADAGDGISAGEKMRASETDEARRG